MKNNVMLILLSLSLAVFGVITTEVAVIGLLPQLTEQLQITAPQVGFLVSIYAVVVAITGPAITHQYDVILFFRILPALTHAVFFAIALVVAANVVPPARSAHAIAIVFPEWRSAWCWECR